MATMLFTIAIDILRDMLWSFLVITVTLVTARTEVRLPEVIALAFVFSLIRGLLGLELDGEDEPKFGGGT